MNREQFIRIFEEKNIPKSECVILSGGSLLIRGLREKTNDFDLAVTKEVGEMFDIENAPKDEKGLPTPFENCQMTDNYDKYDYDEIDGFKCQKLEEILAFKKSIMREKDLKDIEKIEEYLESHQ